MESNRPLTARVQEWLEGRDRDAQGLVAAWYMTGGKTFLEEAAKKFPNDPRVCMAMIQSLNAHTEKAMPWIERLLAAEPDNPEALYQKCWAHMDGRWETVNGVERFNPVADRPAAMEALHKAAVATGRREDYMTERMQTVHEAAIACGLSPAAAVRLALEGPQRHSTTTRALRSARDALLTERAAAQASGDEQRLMEITGLALMTSDKLSNSLSKTLEDEFLVSNLRTGALEGLPDDTELGAGGRPLGQYREEVEQRNRQLAAANSREEKVAALLQSAGDEWMTGYFNRYLTHGEDGARLRLLQLAGAGQ